MVGNISGSLIEALSIHPIARRVELGKEMNVGVQVLFENKCGISGIIFEWLKKVSKRGKASLSMLFSSISGSRVGPQAGIVKG